MRKQAFRRVGLVLLAPLLLGVYPALPAPVTAVSREVHLFNSPMILEYSLDEMLGRANGLTTEEFSFFSCRGVSIERVSLGIVPGKKKDQASDLQVALKLFNNSGKDKRVTIDLELMNREVRVSGLLKKLNVGQGDPSSLTITLPFPLKRGEAGVEPKLRVTLELVDY